jgi:hypothetical protein
MGGGGIEILSNPVKSDNNLRPVLHY